MREIQRVRLCDITTKVGSGSTPRGGESAYQIEGVPLIRSMNVHFGGFRRDGLAFLDAGQAAALKNVEVKANDVLLNITGASIGRVTSAPADMDGARVNQHVCIIRPDARLESSFLRWFLASPSQQRLINGIESGATRQALTKEKILDFEIPLPELDQQRAIVDELEKQFSRLDEAVANLQRVKANLKRYKASVLKAAVEGRLVPTEAERARREGRSFETGEQLLQRILAERRSNWRGRGKFRSPEMAERDASILPEGWTWSSIDQLAEVGTGATPNRSKVEYWSNGDVPWVTSGVANGDYVDKASELVTQRALAETNLTLYPAGTLLIAMYGEGKTRGKCAELRIPATTNQALAALQVDAQVRVYVRHFLELNYEEMRKVASGGVQPNLNLSLVRAVAVPLPPLAEQGRIVAEVDRRLSLVRGVEADVDINLKRAQALRQAALARSFVGP